MDHFCRHVFPVFDLIQDESKSQLVKLLAEICLFTADLPEPRMAARNIHEKLLVSSTIDAIVPLNIKYFIQSLQFD